MSSISEIKHHIRIPARPETFCGYFGWNNIGVGLYNQVEDEPDSGYMKFCKTCVRLLKKHGKKILEN